MSRMIPVFLMVILLGASYSQMSWVEPEKETTVVASCPLEEMLRGDIDGDELGKTAVHLGMVIVGNGTIAVKRTQFF